MARMPLLWLFRNNPEAAFLPLVCGVLINEAKVHDRFPFRPSSIPAVHSVDLIPSQNQIQLPNAGSSWHSAHNAPAAQLRADKRSE